MISWVKGTINMLTSAKIAEVIHKLFYQAVEYGDNVFGNGAVLFFSASADTYAARDFTVDK